MERRTVARRTPEVRATRTLVYYKPGEFENERITAGSVTKVRRCARKVLKYGLLLIGSVCMYTNAYGGEG